MEILSNSGEGDQSMAACGVVIYAQLMITGMQMRMARAALRWSVEDLAEESGVSASTIRRAELTDDLPSMRSVNLVAIQQAFERHGIVLLSPNQLLPGGQGLRLRQ
jgi:DNA-binding XRE family transcriptional regulator